MMFGGGCVCGMLVGNSLFPTITPYIYIVPKTEYVEGDRYMASSN